MFPKLNIKKIKITKKGIIISLVILLFILLSAIGYNYKLSMLKDNKIELILNNITSFSIGIGIIMSLTTISVSKIYLNHKITIKRTLGIILGAITAVFVFIGYSAFWEWAINGTYAIFIDVLTIFITMMIPVLSKNKSCAKQE